MHKIEDRTDNNYGKKGNLKMIDILISPKEYAQKLFNAGFISPDNTYDRLKFRMNLYDEMEAFKCGPKYIYATISELTKISKKKEI